MTNLQEYKARLMSSASTQPEITAFSASPGKLADMAVTGQLSVGKYVGQILARVKKRVAAEHTEGDETKRFDYFYQLLYPLAVHCCKAVPEHRPVYAVQFGLEPTEALQEHIAREKASAIHAGHLVPAVHLASYWAAKVDDLTSISQAVELRNLINEPLDALKKQNKRTGHAAGVAQRRANGEEGPYLN